MAGDNEPTLDEIEAEIARRRSVRSRVAASGQPVSVEAIDAEIRRRQEAAQQPQRQQPRARRQQPRVGQAEDIGRSLVEAIPRGFAALAALPREIDELSANWARDNEVFGNSPIGVGARELLFGSPYDDDAPGTIRWPSTREIDRAVIEPVIGEQHQPQTLAGEYARTIGEFAPGAIFPGSFATRATRVVVPGAASEAGGQIGRPFGEGAETAGRLIGGIGAGLAVEGSIAANARRAARQEPNAESMALEREFGPLTRGERSGNARQRLDEDDLRRGIGSDQAQSIMRTHDARRGQTIRDNAMGIVTRGRPALSQDMGEAGTILGDELRTAREASRARATQQYEAAFNAAKNEQIPAGLNELPSTRVQAAADEFGFDVPPGAQRAIANLERQIQSGEATHANVERARQQLNRELGSAVNSRDDAAEFVFGRVIDALDDWQGGVLRNPEARRAMQEARGIYAETAQLYGRQGRTELSTGHTGRLDPGGRAVDRAINTDLTGEQIIDGILGSGTRPSQQALGAVRRIRELGTERIIYTNRGAASGVRVPGRTRVGGRTAGQRRFAADDPNAPPTQQNPAGGMEQPTEILQSLREGLWHRMLRPLDDYMQRVELSGAREGGLLPAQRMVSQLDNALNKSGREVMRLLYTERELQAMQRLLRYLQRIVPPPGAAVSNTPAGVYRMISNVFDKAVGVIPGLGPVLREAVSEATSTGAARQAVRAPRPQKPVRVNPQDQPTAAVPAMAGALALPPPEERRP